MEVSQRDAELMFGTVIRFFEFRDEEIKRVLETFPQPVPLLFMDLLEKGLKEMVTASEVVEEYGRDARC